MRWEIGEVPFGWKRGESVRLVPALGRFRGFVHIEQDVHGFPLVMRARGIPLQLEFNDCDRWKVNAWLEWWRQPVEVAE